MEDRIIIPDAWKPGLDALRALPDGSIALMVGPIDRGKTTFTTMAARRLAQDGLRVAVVDADIGQSEIGPPGTVGVAGIKSAWANDAALKLTDLRPSATYFVGAFAPISVLLELVTATAQAVRFAVKGGAQRILVDTTGFVTGPIARRLKVAKVQAVGPAFLVGFGTSGEIGDLMNAMQAACGADRILLETPPAVGRKTPALRATRRLTRLGKALENAREVRLSLPDLQLIGCTLGTGETVGPELVTWTAQAVRLPVVRVEICEGTVTLFVDGSIPHSDYARATALITAHFRAQTVRLVSLQAYSDAYVGVQDSGGRLLGVGRVVGYDAPRDELRVFVPPSVTPERAGLVLFGRVRIAGDGSPLGELRANEL